MTHHVLDESRHPKDGVQNLRRMGPWTYFRMVRASGLIHIHSSNHFVRLVHTLAGRLMGRTVLQTVHSCRGSHLALAALRLACWFAHASIGVSREVALGMGRATAIVPAFIPPGAEEESLPAELAKWLSRQVEAGRKIISMNASNTSRINGVDLYGLDLIVDALNNPRLRAKYAAVVCVSQAGPDPAYLADLRSRVQEAGLSERLLFYTDHVPFAAVLKKSDVFVRPTITDGDAVSIREALWYGVPAVASDAVPRPPGTYVFPSRNLSGLIEAIHTSQTESHGVRNAHDFSGDIIQIYASLT